MPSGFERRPRLTIAPWRQIPARLRHLAHSLDECAFRSGTSSLHLYVIRAARVKTALPATDQPVRWIDTVEIAGGAKTGLFMHPDSSATFRIRVRPRSVFRAFVALLPEAWGRNSGGVVFAVEVRTAESSTVISSERAINPAREPRHQGWTEVRLDLRRFEGVEIELELATRVPNRGDPSYAWAVWGDPAIFSGVATISRAVSRVMGQLACAALRGGLNAEIRRILGWADRLFPQTYLRDHDLADGMQTREGMQQPQVQPTVSLMIPVEGPTAQLLAKSLESLMAQLYDRWEVWVCGTGLAAATAVKTVLRDVTLAPRVRFSPATPDKSMAASLNEALGAASGEFVAVMTPGDELSPDALYRMVATIDSTAPPDVLYSDEDIVNELGMSDVQIFKPGWSPELALSYPYSGRLCLLRRELLLRLGGWREECLAAEEYDLLLRAAAAGATIAHVGHVLYHRRRRAGHEGDLFATTAALAARQRALKRYFEMADLDAAGVRILPPVNLKAQCAIAGKPLVSIVIPTRDLVDSLRRCIGSIESRTLYDPYEIVIVDNASMEPQTRAYLAGCGHRVLYYPGPFNFSAVNNAGARTARGQYLLFLNNDTEVITPEWLSAMLEWAQQPPIACVGAKLLLGDGRIQHVGVALLSGSPHHVFYQQRPGEGNRWTDTELVRNYSAVTGACLMVRRDLFEGIGGLDESFPVNYNDVDLCLRLMQRGYRHVYTPYAILYHHESSSRAPGVTGAEERHLRDVYGELLWNDPYWPAVDLQVHAAV